MQNQSWDDKGSIGGKNIHDYGRKQSAVVVPVGPSVVVLVVSDWNKQMAISPNFDFDCTEVALALISVRISAAPEV